MEELTDDKMVETILRDGPITLEEFGRMAYPVRAAYLALMLSWAKQHGMDSMIEQRDALKPMVLRGLEEVAEMIQLFWEREDPETPVVTIKTSGT
jgi:hypothetical protein